MCCFRQPFTDGGRQKAGPGASRPLRRALRNPCAASLERRKQRTALARVLFAAPKVILADEPTASLDGKRAEEVTMALIGAAKRLGATLILVSHDPRVLAHFPQKVVIAEGRLIEGK